MHKLKLCRWLTLCLAAGLSLQIAHEAHAQRGRLDANGDPLPAGAIARLGTVRFRCPTGMMFTLAMSPNGKTLATVSGKNTDTLTFWDAQTGKILHRFGTKGYLVGLEFSRDSTTLASFGPHDADSVLWNVATGNAVRRFKGQGCTFSPDGKTIATATAGGNGPFHLHLWDAISGEKIRQLDLPHAAPRLLFMPDNRTLAIPPAGKETGILLLDTHTGRTVQRLLGHKAHIMAFAVSPDGKTLAAEEPFAVRVWDLPTGKMREQWEYADRLEGLAFSPDGQYLAWGESWQNLYLWKVTGKDRLRKVTAGGCHELAFTPDSKDLVTITQAGVIRFWDVASGKEKTSFTGHQDNLHSVVFSEDAKMLISSSREAAIVWDLAKKTEHKRYPSGQHHGQTVLAVAPGGRWLALADREEKVQLVEPASGKTSITLPKVPLGYYASAVFSPDAGRLAIVGDDVIARLFDTASGNLLRQFGAAEEYHGEPYEFTRDGKILQVMTQLSRPERFAFYETETGRKLLPFVVEPRKMTRKELPAEVALSPDGKTLAWAAQDGTIRFWDFAAHKELAPLRGTQGQVGKVFYSPDGRYVGTWNVQPERGRRETVPVSVFLWDRTKGKSLTTFGLAQGSAHPPAFSDDGRTLALVDEEGAIRLWEVVSGKERARFAAEAWDIETVVRKPLVFSPDGKMLASLHGTAVMLWDVTGHMPDGRWQPVHLAPGEMQLLWNDLGHGDAGRAYRTLWTLAAVSDQTVSFLRKQLRPAVVPEPQRLAQWLADLSHDHYPVRTRAMQALAQLGEMAEPALKDALKRNPQYEARRRMERLLQQLAGPVTAPERLQLLRGVELLERIGTREAQRLLTELAKGTPQADLTQEAKASLARWRNDTR